MNRKLILKSLRLVPFGDNLALLKAKSDIPIQVVLVADQSLSKLPDVPSSELSDDHTFLSGFCDLLSSRLLVVCPQKYFIQLIV